MIGSKVKLLSIAIGAIGLIVSYIAIYFYGKSVSETEWQTAKAEFEKKVRKEQKELDTAIFRVREEAYRQRIAQARKASIVEKEVVRYVEKEQEAGTDNVCIPDERGVQLYSNILGGAEGVSDAESGSSDPSSD